MHCRNRKYLPQNFCELSDKIYLFMCIHWEQKELEGIETDGFLPFLSAAFLCLHL